MSVTFLKVHAHYVYQTYELDKTTFFYNNGKYFMLKTY